MKIPYSILILFLIFSVISAFGDDASAPTQEQLDAEAEVNRKEFEFMEGEWFAYVIKGNRKNLRTAYSYILSQQGEWNTRDLITDKVTPTGRFSILDGKLVFVRKADAKSQMGMEAQVSAENFIVKSAMQEAIFLQFEKKSDDQLIQVDDIVGKWKFYQIVGDTERKSSFTVEFQEDGKYSVINSDGKINESLLGQYEIKGGFLNLINQAPETDLLWHKSSFFVDGKKLVLNNLNFYCFALKD